MCFCERVYLVCGVYMSAYLFARECACILLAWVCVCVHVCVLKLLGLLLSLPPVVPVSRRRSRVRWPRPAAGDWWVVWRVCGVQGVSLEECAVGEGAVADGAGEGALHAVGAHVNIQRALLREALAADGALEGPHTGVHHHVLQQIVTQREGAPADAALVRLLTCTHTHTHTRN